jgi:glycosyltransferase involved in cell wall biosynthesis
VIDLAKRLKTRPEILFVLVGDGPEKDQLMKKAQEAGFSNLSFVPFQETTRIPYFLSAADILFVTLVPAEHRKGTIPAKILAYLSMEKPLLIAAEGEAAQVVLESGGGRVVRPGDVEEIFRAIIELIDNGQERQEMAKKGRRYVLENFDKEKICLALEKRLIEIAGQKNKNS